MFRDEKSEKCDPLAPRNIHRVRQIEPTPSVVLAPISAISSVHRPPVDEHYGRPNDDEVRRADKIRDDLLRITTLRLSTTAFAQLCIRVQRESKMVGWINESASSAITTIENILAGAKADSLEVIESTIRLLDK